MPLQFFPWFLFWFFPNPLLILLSSSFFSLIPLPFLPLFTSFFSLSLFFFFVYFFSFSSLLSQPPWPPSSSSMILLPRFFTCNSFPSILSTHPPPRSGFSSFSSRLVILLLLWFPLFPVFPVSSYSPILLLPLFSSIIPFPYDLRFPFSSLNLILSPTHLWSSLSLKFLCLPDASCILGA